MSGYLVALAYAAIPAAANFVGGLIAESISVSKTTLSLALHAATGIVLAVVGLELMPEALASDAPWVPLAAFVAGGAFFLFVERQIDRFSDGGGAGPWAIWFAVAADLFSDGLMIGTGSVIASGLGLLLAIGQAPADLPEGFASIAALRDAGVARARRILFAALFAVPIFLGTTVGYWVVRGQPELVQVSLLAFTGGVLTTVVVEELVPEAHEVPDVGFAALTLVGGFALFGLIAAYLG